MTDNISTHALTWRATAVAQQVASGLIFLPTPSHGGRLLLHTRLLSQRYFYPRPHMEGDHRLELRLRRSGFLPTPSHGGRPSDVTTSSLVNYFYPRPHMEGDGNQCECTERNQQFLPTPSHGGRRIPFVIRLING